MKLISKLVLVFCLFVYGLSFAQDTKELTVVNQDGTTDLLATTLIDSDGFMWNATEKSIMKRVGNQIVYFPYNHPEKKTIGFAHLIEANKDVIIGFSMLGCFKLNKQSGTVEWIYDYFDRYTPPIKDDYGNIWATTYTGDISFCYTQEGKLAHFEHKDYLTGSGINTLDLLSIQWLNDESLLAKSEKGLWYVIRRNEIEELDPKVLLSEPESNRFSRVEKNRTELLSKPSKETYNMDRTSFILRSNAVFKKGFSGTFVYKNQKYKYKYLPKLDQHLIFLPVNYASSLVRINQNNADFALIYDNTIEIIRVDNDLRFNVINSYKFGDRIRNYFLDAKNNRLLVNVNGKFHSILINSGMKKYRLFDELGKERSTSAVAKTITKTSNGNIYFQGIGYRIFELKKGENVFNALSFPSVNLTELMSGVRGFHKKNDSVFIAYGNVPKVFVTDIKNKTIQDIKLPTDNSEQGINDVILFNENTLLLLGDNSIMSFDLHDYEVKRIKDLESYFSDLDYYINTGYYDKSRNQLWLGVNRKGLYRIDLNTNQLSHFTTKSQLSLIHNNVNVIYPDKNNVLWIGTNRGLQKIDAERLISLETYGRDNSLKNYDIRSIVGDEEYLWIGTISGFFMFDKALGVFRAPPVDLSYFEHTRGFMSMLRVNKDSLFIGGRVAMTKINPSEYQSKKTNTLVLTKVTYYDNKLKEDVEKINNLGQISSFDIPFKQNYLFLSFGTNEVFDSEKVTYQYKIEGINRDWVNINNVEGLFLQGIKTGLHKLKIRAFSSMHNPTNTLEYDLLIDSPFYMKAWFYIIIVLSLLSGSVLFFLFLRKKHKKDRAFHELETKSSQAQMLPHFTFNTINCIQSVMLTQGELEANKVIVEYSKLLRHTLDVFHSELISLQDEINYLRSYLKIEQMRAKFSFSIEVDNTIDAENLLIPPMMFQPLIENSIKHGIIPKKGEAKLTIVLTIRDGFLIGEVMDNGIGRKASEQLKLKERKKHKSWSTKILEDRIRLFNNVYSKKISFEIKDLLEKGVAFGTKAILTIPLNTKQSFKTA